MPAIAFSNNDIALVAWTFDRHLDGCLGFSVHQIDLKTGKERPLPAKARFAGQDPNAHFTTDDAPVQKFWWKDLFAERGGTYQYRIVPMGGTPGHLKPLADVPALLSNQVTLTPIRPPFSAYFNRGLTATQALSHELKDKPSIDALTPHILDPNDPIRIGLMGQLQEGVTSLLDRADKGGGVIHAALYELNDPNGLEKRLQANPKSRTVILGNEQSVDRKTKEAIEDADAENRKALKAAGVKVIDRVLGKGDIPHNKFMVLSEQGKPTAALSGSTNWTSTGLCTQTNNALVIESGEIAQLYLDYWNAVNADTAQAQGDHKKLQSKTLRDFTRNNNATAVKKPVKLANGVTVEVMFSPNTPHKLSKNPDTPNDMARVFELMDGAKHAILFLAFDPGNNSILDKAGALLAKKPDLFVRGALTSAQRAEKFSEALHAGGAADAPEDTEAAAKPPHTIKVVGEAGQPKPEGGHGTIDIRAVPAGAVTGKDAFGGWEAELAKYGFAIIHNKIVVIDPFSDDCVVVTGSHNLGFRASHNNDENMVIIRGHRALAEAYACHVLDLYDHYAWRYLLQKHPKEFGKPLEADDKWQERYIKGADEKAPELRFWLSAAQKLGTGSDAGSSPAPDQGRKPSGKQGGPVKKKPAPHADSKPPRPIKPAGGGRKTPKRAATRKRSDKKTARPGTGRAGAKKHTTKRR